jgi:hypothetical protein
MKTVWIYCNAWQGEERPMLRVGDVNWVKVFATREDANRWLEENDPEGVAFEYPIEEAPHDHRRSS